MSNFLDQQPNKSPTLLTDNMCPFEVKAPTLLTEVKDPTLLAGGGWGWFQKLLKMLERAKKAQIKNQPKKPKLFKKYTDFDYDRSGALIRNRNDPDDVGCHRVNNWAEAEELCKNNNKCGGFTYGKGLRLHGSHKNRHYLRACLYEYSYDTDWNGRKRKQLLPVPPNIRTKGIGVDYGRKLK